MLILEIDIRQLLSGVVDHDEAGVIEFFKDRGGDYSRALQQRVLHVAATNVPDKDINKPPTACN